MIFQGLKAEQVTSVHKVYCLLRRLRVCSLIMTSTVQYSNSEAGRPILYKIIYNGHDESMRGKYTEEERFEIFFDRDFSFRRRSR